MRSIFVLAPLLTATGCLAPGPGIAPPAVVSPEPAASSANANANESPSVIVLRPDLDARPRRASATGVDACDRYIAFVDACPNAAAARTGATRVLLDKDAPTWREIARSSTEGRLAVTAACENALQSLGSRPCEESPR